MRDQPFSARSGSERLRALTIAGVLLLPLVVGGLLTWALSAPRTNLDRVTAAVVNNDVPATVNGNTIPIGRQFAAGLIGGDGSESDNFAWVLTNDAEAREGLDRGNYAAVVTIPSDFSAAAATSISGPASSAIQAFIDVEVSPSSAFLDPALTEAVTASATVALNRQLTSQYLGNVYAGFNAINSEMGQASSGAASLASGAASVSSGSQTLASGAATLASGAGALDEGAASLAAGLGELDRQSQGLPGQTAQLARGAGDLAVAIDTASASLTGATAAFTDAVAQVCQTPGLACDAATRALGQLQVADHGVAQLAGGADEVATGSQQLAAAMPQLAAGLDESASGAAQVATGAAQTDTGASELSTGATSLVDGAIQVDSGAAQLAGSLADAVEEVPTYSDSDIETLSGVVARPVLVDEVEPAPGLQAVPLFCVVALWLGGLVIALARRAVPSRHLMTTVASLTITLRGLLTDALLGMAQGLIVAPFLLLGLAAQPVQWLSFTVLSMVAGAVFAIVNHGLVAALGAGGRLIAVFVAVIAFGVGLASTVPPVFSALTVVFPTSPALSMLRGAARGDIAIVWWGLVGCLLFAVIGALLVFAGVSLRRSVRVRDLVRGRSRDSGSLRPLPTRRASKQWAE